MSLSTYSSWFGSRVGVVVQCGHLLLLLRFRSLNQTKRYVCHMFDVQVCHDRTRHKVLSVFVTFHLSETYPTVINRSTITFFVSLYVKVWE